MLKVEEKKTVRAIKALAKAVHAVEEASGGSNPVLSSIIDNPTLFEKRLHRSCGSVHVRYADFRRLAELLGETDISEYEVPCDGNVSHYVEFTYDGISVFAIQ